MITLKEKVLMYETFLHNLQLYSDVIPSPSKVKKMIDNACKWSYAHRTGNGELTDEDQQVVIDKYFLKLLDK